MTGRTPTIAVAIPAYNAERWIAATLESVLAQTDPPDEVIVVDDGSTDATAEIAGRFAAVRVLRQANMGAPAAYNRGFDEARSDYVAMLPADDLWRPRKIERQRATLAARPEIDVTFAHARMFGLIEEEYERPSGRGVLDWAEFAPEMYRVDLIPAPTAVVRRSLHVRLGRFREDLLAEDYEFWLRALEAGAIFHYDERCMLDYRRHEGNLSGRLLEIRELDHAIHERYAGLVDRRLARRVLSDDLRQIGRFHLDAGRLAEARRAYAASLRHRLSAKALVATAGLSLPGLAAPSLLGSVSMALAGIAWLFCITAAAITLDQID